VLALLTLGATSLAVGSALAQSHLDRPHGPGVGYLVVTGGGGQLNDGDQARPGYTVSAILRPHRAADFYHSLYAWNTALVLQVDKQGGGPATILSGDLILRHYLADMRPLAGGRSWFFGLGAGLSHVDWIIPAASPQESPTSGSADNPSFLAEIGLEWNLDPALVLMGKGQYRLYDRDGHDLSGWSLQAGAGLPLPF
jgi:hypothetical protein